MKTRPHIAIVFLSALSLQCAAGEYPSGVNLISRSDANVFINIQGKDAYLEHRMGGGRISGRVDSSASAESSEESRFNRIDLVMSRSAYGVETHLRFQYSASSNSHLCVKGCAPAMSEWQLMGGK